MKLSELLQEHPEYMDFTLGELIDSTFNVPSTQSKSTKRKKQKKLDVEIAILSNQFHTREDLSSILTQYLPWGKKGIQKRFDGITAYFVHTGSHTVTIENKYDWLTTTGMEILGEYSKLNPIYYAIRFRQPKLRNSSEIIVLDTNKTELPITFTYKDWQSLGTDYNLLNFHKKSSTP